MSIFLYFLRALLLGVFLISLTLYGLIVFPFFPHSKNKIHHLSLFFQRMSLLLGLHVEVRHSNKAKEIPQAVYVANHQNNADLFTLCHMVAKGVVTVGKKSLFWIPFFGILYWISGNVLINRSNRKQAIATIDQVAKKMQNSQLSILMFPEGTRSRGRGLLPFKTGAFHTAIKAGVPIVPIICSNTHQQAQLGRWNNGKVIVEMLDPISTEGLAAKDAGNIMKQCRQAMEKKYQELNKELGR